MYSDWEIYKSCICYYDTIVLSLDVAGVGSDTQYVHSLSLAWAVDRLILMEWMIILGVSLLPILTDLNSVCSTLHYDS